MKFLIVLFFIFAILFVANGIFCNNYLQVTEIPVTIQNLPENFQDFKIVQISDLHNAEFGGKNERLITKITEQNPDIIVLTGDLVDRNRTDLEVALDFAREIIKIAPCYYVTGNHEARVSNFEDFEKELREIGVEVLRDEIVEIKQNDETIILAGIDDVFFREKIPSAKIVEGLLGDISDVKILLSHRPDMYGYEADLILSGHIHGGQIRLPIIGGLACPNTGLFPQYDSRLYIEENTNLVVSRGLGNSIFPFRINNPAEIVCVILKAEDV